MTSDELKRFLSELYASDDAMLRWGRLKPQPELPSRERKLDTAPIDWDVRIREAIERQRQFQHDVLVEVIAEIRVAANNDLERATRSLTAELADLRATVAELRLVMANERDKAIVEILPNPLPRRVN